VKPEGDRIDEQVRLAVEALPDAPVRWDRIARKTRWRRWVALLAAVLAVLALTLVVATGLLAGKSAIDPSFSPPLVSHTDLAADFEEPAFGHGLVPLSKFEQVASRVEGIGGGVAPGALGYVFKVALTGGELDPSEPLRTRWRIRHRGNTEALPLAMVSSTAAEGEDANGDELYEVWVEEPPRAGQFVVDFSLMSPAGPAVSGTSAPLHVVTHGLLHRYVAGAYVAGVPEGWHVDSNYEPEPGHRFVTRLEGPHGMSVLIDTTPGAKGDPADSAATVESQLGHNGEPYKRLEFARRDFGGPAFEWCFELGDQASTDIFFFRGGDGYAVLAESPESRFREARLVARAVARSLRDRAPRGVPSGG
jgi:hypothetical protein